MPKYDAFGREIGEDSLESLGWSSGGTVTPSPEPTTEPPPAPTPPPPAAGFGATPPPPPPPPNTATAGDPLAGGDPFAVPPPPPPPARYRKRRGGTRVMSRLVAFAVFVVIAINVVPGFFNGVKDATDGLNIDIPEIDAPAVPETKAVKPPVGLGEGSLIRRAAFTKSLIDLRGRGLGKLTHLRLAPERIDVQTLKNGRLTASQLSTADGFRKFSTTGPGFGNSTTVPWGRLNPGAPERLVRAAAERIHKPVSKIDYLVASEFDGKIVWGAYFKGGQIVQGDARGKVTRRIS